MESTVIGALLGFIAAVFPRIFIALGEHFAHRKDIETTAQTIDAASKGIVVVGRSEAAATADYSYELPANSTTDAPATPNIKVYSAKSPKPCIDREGPDPDDEAELEAGNVRPLLVRAFATLRAGVRPLITYGFFLLFAFVKFKGMLHGLYVDHTPAILLLPVLWDEGTQALFASVLAFWFGSRALEKQQQSASGTGKVSAGDNP